MKCTNVNKDELNGVHTTRPNRQVGTYLKILVKQIRMMSILGNYFHQVEGKHAQYFHALSS